MNVIARSFFALVCAKGEITGSIQNRERPLAIIIYNSVVQCKLSDCVISRVQSG